MILSDILSRGFYHFLLNFIKKKKNQNTEPVSEFNSFHKCYIYYSIHVHTVLMLVFIYWKCLENLHTN